MSADNDITIDHTIGSDVVTDVPVPEYAPEYDVQTQTGGAGGPIPPGVDTGFFTGDAASTGSVFAGIGPASAADDRPHRKIGIVGYTTSREEAPYADASWEFWGMNNLHKHAGVKENVERYSRWYNLHDHAEIESADPEHYAWLKESHPFPIYMMDPQEGVDRLGDGAPMPSLAERTGFPSVVPFPRLAILSQFMRYFTNTVAWQIAHSIYEALFDEGYIYSDLALYGIDMATGTEYAAQRPSVEYFLGLAQGLGVELHIPPSSDLLKAAELYGGEDENFGMRAKVATRLRELHEQKAHIETQLEQGQMMHASVCGAIDSFAYIQGVWLPPTKGEAARDKVIVPAGSLTPVAQMIAEGEKRDRETKKGTT